MNIKLIREMRGEALDLSVEENTTIEELYRQHQSSLPYTVLAAKVDNKIGWSSWICGLRPPA